MILGFIAGVLAGLAVCFVFAALCLSGRIDADLGASEDAVRARRAGR